VAALEEAAAGHSSQIWSLRDDIPENEYEFKVQQEIFGILAQSGSPDSAH